MKLEKQKSAIVRSYIKWEVLGNIGIMRGETRIMRIKFQAYSGMMVKEESSEQLIKMKYVWQSYVVTYDLRTQVQI